MLVRLLRLGIVLAVTVALPFAKKANAAWGGFVPIGPDVLVSDPACAADGNGTAVCAALGSGSTMMVARFNGSTWGGWTHFSGVLTTSPSCATIAAGRVVCASRNAGLQMVAYLFSGGTWTAPLVVQNDLTSAPSCAALASGKAICAARSGSGGIVSAVYGGSGWTSGSWTSAPFVSEALYSGIQCTTDTVGHAICAYLSRGSATTVREFGTAWSGGLNIGGTATRPPSCTEAGVGGKVACFATGTNSELFGQAFAGGSFTAANWGGYRAIGGLVNAFSCTQDGQKAGLVRYVCGVTALTDSGFYTSEYDGTFWSAFAARGGTFIGAPNCFALNRSVTPGRVMCVLTTNATKAVSIVGP